MKTIEIPSWFKEGMSFTSKWINYGDNICTVISFSPAENKAEVKITTDTSDWVEDNWNLQHTIWGFSSMDYRKIKN